MNESIPSLNYLQTKLCTEQNYINKILKLRVTISEQATAIENLELQRDGQSIAIKQLNAKLAASRFIYRTNERHKYQDKIEYLKAAEILIRADRDGWIADSEYLNSKLMKANVLNYENEDLIKKLRNRIKSLESKVDKLTNQPKLNRLEVHSLIWNLLGEVNCQDIFIDQDENGEYIQNEESARLDMCVTAICELGIKHLDKIDVNEAVFSNIEFDESTSWWACKEPEKIINAILKLAIPKINKEKIVKVLDKIKDCICEPDKIDIYLHEILKEVRE